MFEFFLRKTMLKKSSKEDQDIILLAKNYIKMDIVSFGLVVLFYFLPLIPIVIATLTCDSTALAYIVWTIFISAYFFFVWWFVKKFAKDIIKFKDMLCSTLYFTRYVVKGNAISEEGFKTIKETNENLYNNIRFQNVQGYCYAICFELLRCLKKGTIQFVAVKSLSGDLENSSNEYTMHVLYVNNNWCFNTYSQTQHPLEEVMKRCMTIPYKSFKFEDIEGKSYQQFRAEHYLALKKWCEENDCYQEWIKED